MTRLARRLRSTLATFVSLSLIVLSPGLEAPRLFAQVIGGAARAAEGVRALPALPGGTGLGTPVISAPAFAAPSLTAPSAFMGAPSAVAPAAAPALAVAALPAAAVHAAVPLAAAPARASIPAMAVALAPHLEAIAKPETSAAGSATAGREIENILTGAKSSGSGDLSEIAGTDGSGAPALPFAAAASAPADAKPGVPAAPAPVEGKVVSSRASYQLHRFLLKTIAVVTGAVNSLPIAGPALSQKLIASAASRRVVLSDYDDTLAAYNQVLPQDMVEAVRAIRAAGKDFAVISDRGDEKRAHQLTVFESLETLPVELRAGMYVAANSGGRVYKYDEKGEPVRVYEVPGLTDDQKAKVLEAATAAKARLSEAGTEQHQPSATNNNPSESWSTYGYAMMLKVGSSKESVVKAGEILQDELNARGLSVEVSPRFAKDPANPPYINFSIVTKAPAAEYIAKALGAKASEVLAIGDNAYAPHQAKKASLLTRLGVKLSGREIPATGNQTDRNMEKGVPGALTLSVGGTGDPTAEDLWVLSGKGPATTRQVLLSVASQKRGAAELHGAAQFVLAALAAAGLITAAGTAIYFFAQAVTEWVNHAEQLLRDGANDPMNGGAMFGGFLGLQALKAKIPQRVKAAAEKYGPAVVIGLFLAAVVAAYGFLIGGIADWISAMEQAIHADWSESARNGGVFLGGTLAYFGMSGSRVSLANPKESYGAALKAAVEIAASRGASADQVRFVEATTSVPVQDGAEWKFTFAVPGKNGGSALVYVDLHSFLGGPAQLRSSVYEGAAPSESKLVSSIAPHLFSLGAQIAPETALGLIRGQDSTFGLRASVALDYREEPVSGDKDLWYRFYDDKGGIASVNTRTGETRVETPKPASGWTLKQSVSKVSPIDGFSTFVYDTGLEAVKELAVKAGYRPDNLRLMSAKLTPGPWGEDWTFSFVSPRESNTVKGPNAYEVKVRRTMVSETLVDAYDAKDLGPRGLFTGFPAALVADAVKISPMEAVAKSGDDARTLEVQARWSDAGPAELVYVLRGEKGREIKSINATTGEETVPQPYAWLGQVLLPLGALGLTIGLYLAIFYAFTHAPAAQSPIQLPEGWQGPVPNGWEGLFGGTLAAGAAAKLRGKGKKAKVTEERVQGAAASVASYKGRPWSQTEYNMAYSNTLESLKKDGATKAQLELFEKLCAEAPIRGGSFNPWSGD
jgi:hydroxymethylpyrimidine pyrophosphatase-like HAD family hydrolase